MSISLQSDATGLGTGTVRADLAAAHLAAIANLDTGLGLGPVTGNLQPVTYTRSDPGVCPVRLDALINTDWPLTPGGPDIIILAVPGNFTLIDGSLITTRGGTALPPAGTGLPGAGLNTLVNTVVLYDISDNNGSGYCLARAGTGGTLDLRAPLSVILYHELSHAFRTVQSAALPLTVACNPSSPEENAAITDENDMRTQLAVQLGTGPAVLRDPGIHCATSCGGGGGGGSCCIVASVSSGSPLSTEVQQLRALRDQFLRRSDVGFAFFDALHYAYYGFSPQVVSVMATDLQLRATVLDGFVRPLIRMLQVIRDHALNDIDVPLLVRRLDTKLRREDVPGALAAGAQAMQLFGGDDADLRPGERTVRELLTTRALPDEHVSWGLVEPVIAYHQVMRAWLDDGPAAVAEVLEEFLPDWSGRLPIDPGWGTLGTDEVEHEVQVLESTLLRDGSARREFLTRLRDELGTSTAVSSVVARRAADWARAEGAAS